MEWKIKKRIGKIKPDNVAKVYEANFGLFMYNNSDKVVVNGKEIKDEMTRSLLLLRNKKGEPNIREVSWCGTKDGFELTELDFIETELKALDNPPPLNITESKQYKTYVKYLKNKRQEFSEEGNTDTKKYSSQNSTSTKIDSYNTQIFKSEFGFRLFEILFAEIVEEKTALADISFIFGKLKKDGFIYEISHRTFIDFISTEYKIVLDKIKTLPSCSTQKKIQLYNIYKDSII